MGLICDWKMHALPLQGLRARVGDAIDKAKTGKARFWKPNVGG